MYFALAKTARYERRAIASLGASPRFGSFRSCTLVPGSVNWDALMSSEDTSLITLLTKFWRPRALEIAFEMTGPNGSLLVCNNGPVPSYILTVCRYKPAYVAKADRTSSRS